MGYSEDEEKVRIPELEKIHIQDLHVFFVSYRDIGAATPDKGRGLASFLMDTDFIYLLVVFLQGGRREGGCREGKALTMLCRNSACGTTLWYILFHD